MRPLERAAAADHVRRSGVAAWSICATPTSPPPKSRSTPTRSWADRRFWCHPRSMSDLRGVGVMGSFDQTVTGEGSPGAPCVRIRGFSLWGSVGVKRKKRKAPTDPV